MKIDCDAKIPYLPKWVHSDGPYQQGWWTRSERHVFHIREENPHLVRKRLISDHLYSRVSRSCEWWVANLDEFTPEEIVKIEQIRMECLL